jgi:hypothetical protein
MRLYVLLALGLPFASGALTGCEDSASGKNDAALAPADAGADSLPRDAQQPDAAPFARDAADASVAEPSTDGPVIPRATADPTRTKKILSGSVELAGGGLSSCSNALPSSTDRWCAFARAGTPANTTELWVINVTKASAGATIVCDGSSPDCARLSSNLWTGSQLYGPSHPYTHRFDGDTLIFHADAIEPVREPYEGPVFAWRPGWTAPRQLAPKAITCFGQRRSLAVYCVADAKVAKDADFSPPHVMEVSVLAGVLDSAQTGPLAVAERLTGLPKPGRGPSFQVALSNRGDILTISSTLPGTTTAQLRVVRTSDVGKQAPRPVAEHVHSWQISHDQARIYVLREVDVTKGDEATGTLSVVGVAAGSPLIDLQKTVYSFELLGAHDEVVSDHDRGLMFLQETGPGKTSHFLLNDWTKPNQVFEMGADLEYPQVATTLEHALYFRRIPNKEWPVAEVMRATGSGSCVLNNDRSAEVYGGHFSDKGKLAFWIEYGNRYGIEGSEEGWYANAQDCSEKRKFGDYVTGYTILGDDFIVFTGLASKEGDDDADLLQYTPLGPAPSPLPRTVARDVTGYSILRHPAPWLVFTGGDGEQAGLFVHGPLTK